MTEKVSIINHSVFSETFFRKTSLKKRVFIFFYPLKFEKRSPKANG